MARLISVNVGLPRDIAWEGRTVHTGIWKSPVQGRCVVRRLNLDGDGQGDLAGHGGEQRAVFVYQLGSYRYWEKQLARNDFSWGQFGENFTVGGLADDKVCIGDRFKIGSALFEVTQPRVTCYRVGMRMNEPRMPALLVSHHRPGFYFRVLQEGEVQSGDEIVKVAEAPARTTVADADAMLYLNAGSKDQLLRALSIPALSPGWQQSFRDILEQQERGGTTGNAGLVSASELPPSWPGFRPLRVSQMNHESSSVLSIVLESTDEKPLSPALPGQYVVLRIHPQPDAPAVMRNYSLSDLPSADHYRISVKLEEHGVASSYLHRELRPGDVLDVSAPRGTFTLRPGDGPIVLLSAGVGATPVLAMLHALAAESSQREVWWLFGARNHEEHPFLQESHQLIKSLEHGRSYVRYSKPGSQDRIGSDFDAPGRIDIAVIEQLAVPRDSDVYLCGPTLFLHDLKTGLQSWGVSDERVHMEIFGAGESITPGIVAAASGKPHQPTGQEGTGPRISFTRSGIDVRWDAKYQSLLELAEACDVPVRWSCRTGVCHTCETAMISGAVSYHPEPLQAPADGNILICCCQPSEDTVLDL
jgi:ferredoxin-NADP reductase/MOSC domain-containing protein YiiM